MCLYFFRHKSSSHPPNIIVSLFCLLPFAHTHSSGAVLTLVEAICGFTRHFCFLNYTCPPPCVSSDTVRLSSIIPFLQARTQTKEGTSYELPCAMRTTQRRGCCGASLAERTVDLGASPMSAIRQSISQLIFINQRGDRSCLCLPAQNEGNPLAFLGTFCRHAFV